MTPSRSNPLFASIPGLIVALVFCLCAIQVGRAVAARVQASLASSVVTVADSRK